LSSTAIDVIVPIWNSKPWLEQCFAALEAQTLRPASIVAVDDGSTDGSQAWLERHADTVMVHSLARHSGFAAAVNHGIRSTSSPLVALLNADTQVEADWLEQLSTALLAEPTTTGLAASRMLQLSDPTVVDSAGDSFTVFGSALKRGHGEPAANWSRPEKVLSACAGAALYRRAMLAKIGLFDDSYESYLEDVDLSLRAQLAGYDCLFVPAARVLHAGGGSGLARKRYVRLVTANRATTVLKNFPASAIWRHLLPLLWGQIYFLLAYRRPLSSLLGYGRFLRQLPGAIRRRREIQASREISSREFSEGLEQRLGEPPLRQLFRGRFERR